MFSKCKYIYLLVVICCLGSHATKHVAILETVSLDDVFASQEKRYLTDKLREVASKVLPSSLDYAIMTSENIEVMLPPGKALEDCEGSCIVETGKNISADYVAQGRLGSFGNQVTLAVELYETISGKLIGSFVERKNTVQEIADEVEQNAVILFCSIQTNLGEICQQKTSDNSENDYQSDFWVLKRSEENPFEGMEKNSRTKKEQSIDVYDAGNSDILSSKSTLDSSEEKTRKDFSIDLRLLVDMAIGMTSYSAPYYDSAPESQSGLGYKFGIGFDFEHSISNNFLFGIGSAFNAYYEYIDFTIPLQYTESSYYSSYTYTSTSDYGYEYSSWFFRLDMSAVVAFGDGSWFLFVRPALSIGLGSKISFQKQSDDFTWKEPDYRPQSAKTDVAICTGMIDIGFRIFDNHEVYVQITPPLFTGDFVESIDYTIYFGYRWAPMLKRSLFTL